MVHPPSARPAPVSFGGPLGLTLLALLAACDSPPFCMSSVCGCEGGEMDTTRTATVDPETWALFLQEEVDERAACDRACLEVAGLETVDACLAAEPTAEGDVDIECEGTAMMYCEGRAPLAHSTRPRRAPRTVTEWACHAARAERDSIVAFRELADVLRALGAPDDLVSRAHQAAIEEAGHTLSMLTLAPDASLGSAPRPRTPRDLVELAVHNAVEGCVGECWAALLALHQAEHAENPAVRQAMAEIAPEEVGHAALAWAIDAWLSTRLTSTEQKRVHRARRQALRRLQRHNRLAHPGATRALGLPDADAAYRLAERFAAWGDAQQA